MSLSLVVLSWKRVENIQRIIDEYEGFDLIGEIIIWNNNMRLMIRSSPKTRVIYSTEDFGMRTRFAAALFATNNCILLHDDDTLLPLSTIEGLYDAWRKDPDVMHGLWGCVPKPDNTYSLYLEPPAEADIIVGRCMVLDQRYCREFFLVERDHPAPIDHSAPHGCEDILMSYLVMRSSGRRNRCHALDYVDLPNDNAICKRPLHYEHRTEFMQRCQDWLSESGVQGRGRGVVDSYSSMTVAELKVLLQEGNLPVSGNKPNLIARLEEANQGNTHP